MLGPQDTRVDEHPHGATHADDIDTAPIAKASGEPQIEVTDAPTAPLAVRAVRRVLPLPPPAEASESICPIVPCALAQAMVAYAIRGQRRPPSRPSGRVRGWLICGAIVVGAVVGAAVFGVMSVAP